MAEGIGMDWGESFWEWEGRKRKKKMGRERIGLDGGRQMGEMGEMRVMREFRYKEREKR